LKDDEQQSQVEVRRLEQKLDIILQQLKDIEQQSQAKVRRLEQKLDIELAKYKTDVKKKMWQFREKMYQAVLFLIILQVLLYNSGYHGLSNHKYIIK
jgi:hypothetical protein